MELDASGERHNKKAKGHVTSKKKAMDVEWRLLNIIFLKG